MIFPVTTFLATELYLAAGNVLLAHGPSMYLLVVAAIVGAAVVPWEIVALVWGSLQLRKHPQLRGRLNILALFAAASYVVGSVVWVIVASGGAL